MSRRIHEASSSSRHEQWMEEHGKYYKDVAEKEKRFQIFKDNVEFIESFNAAANETFQLSINQFADQTNEEFKAWLNGQKRSLEEEIETKTAFRYDNFASVPATMDWRERGAVTPIKNQGRCGSCWAFATVAVTEGIHQIATGSLVSLSEQELVDCVKGKSEGCEGGYVDDAFKFIIKKRGIASEAEYPYKGVNGTCHVVKKGTYSAATIKGYERVPSNDEKALLKAVANQPVSIYIEASQRAFQFYSSGVFIGKCGTELDHAVTIVGYGASGDHGVKYWLVKNSWGTKWGENGYIKMKRHAHAKEGLCGLAMFAYYPIA